MKYACIDLEGVLIPELWPILAEAISVPDLAITTREVPGLRHLMERRLSILREQGVRLTDVYQILHSTRVLQGANAFLKGLSRHYQLILVSDAFSQMVAPLILRQLTVQFELECHRFEVDTNGFIDRCQYAARLNKEDVILRLQSHGGVVLAVGDAFNDLKMLKAADKGYLYRPSPQTASAARYLAIVKSYSEIQEAWTTQIQTGTTKTK